MRIYAREQNEILKEQFPRVSSRDLYWEIKTYRLRGLLNQVAYVRHLYPVSCSRRTWLTGKKILKSKCLFIVFKHFCINKVNLASPFFSKPTINKIVAFSFFFVVLSNARSIDTGTMAKSHYNVALGMGN